MSVATAPLFAFAERLWCWTDAFEFSISSNLLLFHQNITLEIKHRCEGVHVALSCLFRPYREEVRVVRVRDEEEIRAAAELFKGQQWLCHHALGREVSVTTKHQVAALLFVVVLVVCLARELAREKEPPFMDVAPSVIVNSFKQLTIFINLFQKIISKRFSIFWLKTCLNLFEQKERKTVESI